MHPTPSTATAQTPRPAFDLRSDLAEIAALNRIDQMCETDPRHYTREESLHILSEQRNARRNLHS